MKNIRLIKWIMSLCERDRFWVMMLITISLLWGQNLMYKSEVATLNKIMLNRADSCEAQKTKILYEELVRTQGIQQLVDSMARSNLFIIGSNNQNIKIVKKSHNEK